VTADGYEWLPPSSPPRRECLVGPLAAARLELGRRARRGLVLRQDVSVDHAWTILLHLFTHGASVTLEDLTKVMGTKPAELLRWLLALQSELLVVVSSGSNEVLLTAPGRQKLSDHFSHPLYVAPLQQRVNERLRLARPAIVRQLHDAAVAAACMCLLSMLLLEPIIALIRA
jgi:hypothetical protein